MRTILKVDEENLFNRLDKFLRKNLPELKMASLYKLIRKGDVKINNKRIKDPSKPLDVGDEVSVWLPSNEKKMELIERVSDGNRVLKPVQIPLDIIYEDEDLISINKDSGISVHPGTGEENRATLIEGLMFYGQQNGFDPYLVHRLDRNTSGVMIISKKRPLARTLCALIAEKSVYKQYSVLFYGRVWEAFSITTPIDSKEASTKCYPEAIYALKNETDAFFTLARVVIDTGRKHQIRRHLSEYSYPVAGDERYGNWELNHKLKSLGLNRQFLHCSKMTFFDPEQKRQYNIEAELKPELKRFLNELREVKSIG